MQLAELDSFDTRLQRINDWVFRNDRRNAHELLHLPTPTVVSAVFIVSIEDAGVHMDDLHFWRTGSKEEAESLELIASLSSGLFVYILVHPPLP
jgi:hypothetical protein